jgi:hypothetical protein
MRHVSRALFTATKPHKCQNFAFSTTLPPLTFHLGGAKFLYCYSTQDICNTQHVQILSSLLNYVLLWQKKWFSCYCERRHHCNPWNSKLSLTVMMPHRDNTYGSTEVWSWCYLIGATVLLNFQDKKKFMLNFCTCYSGVQFLISVLIGRYFILYFFMNEKNSSSPSPLAPIKSGSTNHASHCLVKSLCR